MKRFWQEPAPNLPSPDALDGCFPSLKRVRLSTSPGELALEGDLRQMISGGNWKHVDQRHWVCKSTGALLERQFGNALSFCLYFSQNAQVWLEIGRSFPHEPPTITRVIHPYFTHAMVTVQPGAAAAVMTSSPFTTSSQTSNTTLVYDQWSPVRRFEDLLEFLVQAMKQVQPRNVITPITHMVDMEEQDVDMRDDNDDHAMKEVTLNLHHELSPNRFDCGYSKHHGKPMPRGEKVMSLENSGNY